MVSAVAIVGVVLAVAVVLIYRALFVRKPAEKIPKGKFSDKLNDPQAKSRGFYDVAIVGAGPSGSTCGHYLAKAGAHVLLLDKQQFPRDKYCGDAVCKTAIEILLDMGIYEDLIKTNKAHIADSGGLVSPSGLSFVGRSHKVLGAIPAAMAVKRTDLDNAIAMRAKKTGADLKENSNVQSATFDEKEGLWTVNIGDDAKTTTSYKARVLVCADGATSGLATKLGLVKDPPDGVCSRQFVMGGTHQFGADGVVFYNRALLPGYAALFRHPNDEVNFCTYLIPGNPDVKNDDCAKWHEFLEFKDPVVSKMLGPNHKWTEKVRVASLRLGGIKKSWADHCIIIGDAAGFIDPMTGEGIHHAMDSGRIASKVLLEAIAAGNYSHFQSYHQSWMNEFGFDFGWSMRMCQLTYKFPILLDAAAAAVQRKGNEFLAKWAEIMTGRIPKIHLLHPQFVIVIGFELTRLVVQRYICGKKIQAKDVIKDDTKASQ